MSIMYPVIKLHQITFILFFLIVTIILAVGSSYAYSSNNRYTGLFQKRKPSQSINLANLTEGDLNIFRTSLNKAKVEDWQNALSWAGLMKNETFKDAITDYILWMKYTRLDPEKDSSEFENLKTFIELNPYLPNVDDLKAKAEVMIMKNQIPYEYAEKYFEKNPPISTETAIKFLWMKEDYLNKAYPDSKELNKEEIKKEVVRMWTTLDFTETEEQIFLNKYYEDLTEKDYIDRIDKLLIRDEVLQAERIFKYVGEDYNKLFYARIKIKDKPKYINNILRTVPRSLRNDEGLLLERVKWYHQYKEKSDAIDILLDIDQNAKYSDEWIRYKKYYAREALYDKKYKQAYFLIRDHGLKEGADFSEAEWLAGWIALRFLEKPQLAYNHFIRLYNNVSYPSSVSKAVYWAGRAAENLGQKDEAIKWYTIAERYPTYYYGQLGIHSKYALLTQESPLKKSMSLPIQPAITQKDEKNIINNRAVKMAYLIATAGKKIEVATDMFKYAIQNSNSKGEIATIIKIVRSIGNEALTNSITRYATYKNVFFIEDSYPIITLIDKTKPEAHLLHSIIKQESGFHVTATSSSGAIGFMQLIPDTAKFVCQKLREKYDPYRLKEDPAYNIKLGSYYINFLIDEFEGSELLAIAAYNAGPSAVKRWIKNYYDPRKSKDIKDVIDWIELISYPETRNYVQKILEGAVIYKYVLKMDTQGYEML